VALGKSARILAKITPNVSKKVKTGAIGTACGLGKGYRWRYHVLEHIVKKSAENPE
jgi:hypothetical protein